MLLNASIARQTCRYEYCSMDFRDSGQIVSIPLVVESFTPKLARHTTTLLIRLATQVQYIYYAYVFYEITVFNLHVD